MSYEEWQKDYRENPTYQKWRENYVGSDPFGDEVKDLDFLLLKHHEALSKAHQVITKSEILTKALKDTQNALFDNDSAQDSFTEAAREFPLTRLQSSVQKLILKLLEENAH